MAAVGGEIIKELYDKIRSKSNKVTTIFRIISIIVNQ